MPDLGSKPTVLILTVPHGACHRNAAAALGWTLRDAAPASRIEIVDVLDQSARWFRAYYNSYLIPLKLWPAAWRAIEGIQQQSRSTSPAWLYRHGVRSLYRYIENLNPDVVIATEVGLCEMAALHKRETGAPYRLVGVELTDYNRGWVQSEVDLYLSTHQDLAAELVAAGAAPEKVVVTGQPFDVKFASLPTRDVARARLELDPNLPVILALFGGTGFGNPGRIGRALMGLDQQLQIVFIAGRNPRLEEQARRMAARMPRARVLGWVDNMEEWMVAADLMISKPGASTLAEGFACGLPILAFDALPGNEERNGAWIEKWGVGRWIRRTEELGPTVDHLLQDGAALEQMRKRAYLLARPRAAYHGARAVMALIASGDASLARTSVNTAAASATHARSYPTG